MPLSSSSYRMLSSAMPRENRILEAKARAEIVVVVLGDRQRFHAELAQPRGGGKDVPRGERDVLDAGAAIGVQEPVDERLARPPNCSASMRTLRSPDWTAWLCTRPTGSAISIAALFSTCEQRHVVQQPGEHLLELHALREMIDSLETRVDARRIRAAAPRTRFSRSTAFRIPS